MRNLGDCTLSMANCEQDAFRDGLLGYVMPSQYRRNLDIYVDYGRGIRGRELVKRWGLSAGRLNQIISHVRRSIASLCRGNNADPRYLLLSLLVQRRLLQYPNPQLAHWRSVQNELKP